MAKGVLFKEIIHSYGSANVGDTIKFEFELADGVDWDQVRYMYADCGSCTTFTVKDRKIIGSVDTTKAGAHKAGANAITKMIYVKIENGEDDYIGDENKKRKSNPLAKKEILQITGVIVNKV